MARTVSCSRPPLAPLAARSEVKFPKNKLAFPLQLATTRCDILLLFTIIVASFFFFGTNR